MLLRKQNLLWLIEVGALAPAQGFGQSGRCLSDQPVMQNVLADLALVSERPWSLRAKRAAWALYA
jgi:hypothetical protein